MAEKQIDEFRKEIDVRKQHEVDSALSRAKDEVSRYKRRYDDLLEDFNRFREKSN